MITRIYHYGNQCRKANLFQRESTLKDQIKTCHWSSADQSDDVKRLCHSYFQYLDTNSVTICSLFAASALKFANRIHSFSAHHVKH